jgi:putative flippase GtrA
MANPLADRLAGSEARRILLFLVAGLVNTGFGYGVYALAVWSGIVPAVAVIVSTIAGVAFNFRTLGAVFAARGMARLPHFVAVYAVLSPLNIGVLHAAQRAGAGPYLAEALALAVVVPLTYLAMRLVVFPSTTVSDRFA